jgi:hypothetical protein
MPLFLGAHRARWYAVPARALFVAFLITWMTFAVTLFGSIVISVIAAALHGTNPDMRFAYRHIALPVAAVVGSVGLVIALVMEIRHYRQGKALEGIARVSR